MISSFDTTVYYGGQAHIAGNKVTLYTDKGVTPLANPFTCGIDGIVEFFCDIELLSSYDYEIDIDFSKTGYDFSAVNTALNNYPIGGPVPPSGYLLADGSVPLTDTWPTGDRIQIGTFGTPLTVNQTDNYPLMVSGAITVAQAAGGTTQRAVWARLKTTANITAPTSVSGGQLQLRWDSATTSTLGSGIENCQFSGAWCYFEQDTSGDTIADYGHCQAINAAVETHSDITINANSHLSGVQIESRLGVADSTALSANSGTVSALFITKAPAAAGVTADEWPYGIYMENCTVGIDLAGTFTTGMNFSGTVTDGITFGGTVSDEVIQIGGTYDHGIRFTADPVAGDDQNSFINIGDYDNSIAVAPTTNNMFGVMHNVALTANVAYWYQAYYTKITTSGTTTNTSIAGHAYRMQVGSSLGAVYGIQCHTNVTATNTCANEIVSVSAYVNLAASTTTTTDRVCALQAMINGSGTAGTVTGDAIVAYIVNAGTVVTTDDVLKVFNQSAATAADMLEIENDGTCTTMLKINNDGTATTGLDIAGVTTGIDLNANNIIDIGDINMNDATTLTIDTGAVTMTQAYHKIAGEGGASDDLAVINGGTAGDIIYLAASEDDDTITLKHDDTGGAGKIVTSDGNDYELDDDNKVVSLVYDSEDSHWHMVGAAGGGGAGDVTAGANITDHAVVRGDGGAKGVQDSVPIIDDTGNLDMGNGPYVKTDKVRAYDGAGLLLHDDGGFGIQIHDGGILTMAKQASAHIQKGATAQPIPNNRETYIDFDNEISDTQSEYAEGAKTGTDDRANGEGADHLIDDGNSQFAAGDVGATVWNTTDDTYSLVTAHNDAGDLTLADAIMANGEAYRLYHARYTATVDGTYYIGVFQNIADMADRESWYGGIKKNGAYHTTAFGSISIAANVYGTLQAFTITSLAANDYVQGYIELTVGAARNLAATTNSNFFIFKLA